MVITKMNSLFSKHGRWVFAVFTAIIIVSFVWFFTPGLDGSIFFGSPTSPSAVAGKIFGRKVTRGELVDLTNSMALALAVSYNRSPNDTTIRDMAWNRAFETCAILEAAQKIGVSVKDKEVVDFIKAMPVFRNEKGLFDIDRYNAYLKGLERYGYNGLDLDKAVKLLLIVNKTEELAASEAIVTPDEIQQFQLSTAERFDSKVARFKAKDFEKEVPVTEDALKGFYSANKNAFLLPPKFHAELIKFDHAAFEKEAASKITETMIRDYYSKNQAEFKSEKSKDVMTLAAATPKIRKTLTGLIARKLAEKAARDLRNDIYNAAGEMLQGSTQVDLFRKMANERGLKPVDVGWFDAVSGEVKGLGKEPLLVQALFACTPRNPVTRVVSGENSTYIALLLDKKDAEPGAYSEVKPKLEERFRHLRAISLAREKASDAALKLSESKNPSAEVAAFSSGGVKFEKLPSFSVVEPPDSPDATLLLQLATALKPGELSKTKETEDGALILFLEKRTPPAQADLEKGRAQAEAIFSQRKKYALMESFNNWIRANSQSYMKRDENGNPQ